MSWESHEDIFGFSEHLVQSTFNTTLDKPNNICKAYSQHYTIISSTNKAPTHQSNIKELPCRLHLSQKVAL